ncbi:MAG: 4-(cytidine 5'-diphospho)-2-C-methyl-D-erythritol kinase [Gammaproteobacteria bacterium]|nr:4-(cytidine 5'-diphospho)-2-C-methyl-D-erythritol kinase [Gammaproteobacteria bacterium]
MSDKPIKLFSPAKLNLFLHILGKREDRYHELQSFFQLLDYGDYLKFEKDLSGRLSLHLKENSTVKTLPIDRNLIISAAKKLRSYVGNPELGARISINKRIPLGAGLGGGSSNAGITLRALNKLWQCNLPNSDLALLGLNLGADVPVFVYGKSAWVEGIGERIKPMHVEPSWYLVITPACLVSTAKIFAHENLTRNSPAIKMADFLAGRARNDCEEVTRNLYPEVDEALNWLSQFGGARMTGTGSAVFRRFETETAAREVFASVPSNLEGFIAKGIDSL